MHKAVCWIFALILFPFVVRAAESSAGKARIHSLKITILSTMLADGGELGEWGFSALVKADGHKILFDTGAHTDVVLKNLATLSIDLKDVPDVILSHSHWDHVGGFMTLRQSVLSVAPTALSRTHASEGIFYSRSGDIPGVEGNPMILIKPEYEKTGGQFIIHDKPAELYPGIWFTGPVPRKYPERNWSGDGTVKTPQGTVEDNLPEDSALIFNTEKGLVVLTGCGHAGVINIIEYARQIVEPKRVYALVGGIHLFSAKDDTLKWTSEKLKSFGVDNFIGAHCTGIETVFRFRKDLGLDRAHAVVGAVGASFDLAKGIDPRHIAQ